MPLIGRGARDATQTERGQEKKRKVVMFVVGAHVLKVPGTRYDQSFPGRSVAMQYGSFFQYTIVSFLIWVGLVRVSLG